MRKVRWAIGLAACVATAAGAQSIRTYRIDANSTKVINLNLCYTTVRIKADGDNDTDLDYSIYDNNGNLVHQDNDSTDLTFATLHPRSSNGCVSYTMRVKNLGDVYNNMRLEMTDQGPALAGNGGGGGGGGVGGGAVGGGRVSNDGKDRNVAIHNHTSEDFIVVRYSNTAADDYGRDRLGPGVIQRARTNRTFNIDDGTGACHFDIQVTTRSGQKYEKRNVDVCAVSKVEFGTEVSD